MPNCSDNLFYIAMPSQNKAGACPSDIEMEFGPGCVGSPVPCPNDISARPHREKVREQIRDYVLLMLGAPVIRVELDEQHVDLAIDEALKIVEEWAPREYFQYYVFQTTPGQSVYEMPPDIGLIRNVFYRQLSNPAFTSTDLGGSIPLEFMYGSQSTFGFLTPQFPVWGSTSEWVVYKQYEQMYNRVSSAIGSWEWLGGLRHIRISPTPCHTQQAIVHYIQKCRDWREVLVQMQEGALIFAQIMLGHIRSKYGNPPGPSGGLILDGQNMLANAIQAKAEWESRLLTRWGDPMGIFVG
jgi:hypothetical protein